MQVVYVKGDCAHMHTGSHSGEWLLATFNCSESVDLATDHFGSAVSPKEKTQFYRRQICFENWFSNHKLRPLARAMQCHSLLSQWGLNSGHHTC
jgi:hypothetical protein